MFGGKLVPVQCYCLKLRENMSEEMKEIILANPRGFCAGVVRAIATVRMAIESHGAPIYVLHEIVHNRHVVDELKVLGAVFVEHLSLVPPGAICIFSAHGVSRQMQQMATALELRTINATCPLVSSVHRMVEKYHRQGIEVIIIGHHRHPEVEGTAGRVGDRVHIVSDEAEAEALILQDSEQVAYVTQTTLSQDEVAGIRAVLLRRFPGIREPGTSICYATQNRQNAARALARECDLVLVVGSKNSSNSNRLREVATRNNTRAYLIDDEGDIDPAWLVGAGRVGITAGASAPERLVAGVVSWLGSHGYEGAREMVGREERVRFSPAALIDSE